MPGEFDLINWIRAQQSTSALVRLAAGDDLAILDWNSDDLLLVGVDQVLDGVHFDSTLHPPRAIGRKAMNRNLSDCAAMACLPAAALVSIALPKRHGVDYAKELYLGISEAGEKFNCPIVGGETGSWDGKLAVIVTILGRSAGITPLRRDGAEPGHFIYVTGALGGSRAGRHMTFEPRIEQSRKLARECRLSSMIDLSDGLSRDLRHICDRSGVGAVVDAAAIPVHDDAIKMSRDAKAALDHALHDGEDYELLLTSPDPAIPLARRIGIITSEAGVWLDRSGQRQPLAAGGWEHAL